MSIPQPHVSKKESSAELLGYSPATDGKGRLGNSIPLRSGARSSTRLGSLRRYRASVSSEGSTQRLPRGFARMTRTDSNSGTEPTGPEQPLSATGMFLRAFGSNAEQPKDQPEENPAGPFAGYESPRPPQPTEQTPPRIMNSPSVIPVQNIPAPAPPSQAEPRQSGPGEFTKLFQAMQEKAGPAAQQPQINPAPVSPAPVFPAQDPRQVPPPAPGEFTRIFVTPSAPAAERPTRVIPETPQYTPPTANPARARGFSSPGVSGSASADQTFTQVFKAGSGASASPPEAPSFSAPYAPTPAAAPPQDSWQQTPAFSDVPRPTAPPPDSSSATGLLSSLGQADSTPRRTEASYRPAEPAPPESFPPYAPPPVSPEPPSGQSTSVTRLIQRLSETPRVDTTQASYPPFPPPAASSPEPPPPPPPASSGPGAFTRMISGDAVKAALEGAGSQAAPPPPAPAASAPAFEPPKFQAPKIEPPKVEPPKIQAPKVEPPKVGAPKLAAPALAAPKSKLEELVPILLILNTFLLIVLLVVVVFAMRAK